MTLDIRLGEAQVFVPIRPIMLTGHLGNRSHNRNL